MDKRADVHVTGDGEEPVLGGELGLLPSGEEHSIGTSLKAFLLWVQVGVRSLAQCPCTQAMSERIHPSIHPSGLYSMQSGGAAEAVSLAIGHNPGWVTTPTQDTSKMVLILPTSEG